MRAVRMDFGLVGTHPPTHREALILSDVTDIDLSGKVPSQHTTYARGFVPYQAGTLRIVNPDGSTLDMTVEANKLYIGVFRRFNNTGTSGVTSGEIMG